MAWSSFPAFSSLSASCFSLTGLILATWVPRTLSIGPEQPPLRPMEGAAVDLGRPHLPQGLAVKLAGVAHVPRQIVTGIAAVPLPHDFVARHLGHDGGGRDGVGEGVPLDDGALGDRDARHGQRVHQDQVRAHGQARHRALHGQVGRAQDVEAVDLAVVGGAHPARPRGLAHAARHALALLAREALRVVDPRRIEPFSQHDRARHHRAAQGAAADLVEARDRRVPLRPRVLLEPPAAAKLLAAMDQGLAAPRQSRWLRRHRAASLYRNGPLLLHAPGLALLVAQVVQLGSPDAGLLDDLDLLDGPRVQGEDALHALAEGDLAHGHGGPGPGPLQADDDALEDLDALALGLLGLALDLLLDGGLLDPHVDADGVPGGEARQVLL